MAVVRIWSAQRWQQQQLWLVDQRRDQRDLLFHPVGAAANEVVEARRHLKRVRVFFDAFVALVRSSHTALLWLLAGGGAGLYLGCMDLLYDVEHATFAKGSGGLIELGIVTMTFVFSLSLLRWGWRRRHSLLALDPSA